MNFDYASLPQRKLDAKKASKFKDFQSSFASISTQPQATSNQPSDLHERCPDRGGNQLSALTHRVPKHLKIIQDNIASRKKQKLAETSLESSDGCAGDNFEYLDHTADVQCHSWGSTLTDAFQAMANCVMNYMIDLSTVTTDEENVIEVEGHDLYSLLFHFLSEMLVLFYIDNFICYRFEIDIHQTNDGYALKSKVLGQFFDPSVHICGTEVKAITYSYMKIVQTNDRTDAFVIIDI